MDITYIPMARGVRHGLEPVAAHASLYLAAMLDWFTRRVLAWSVSITLEAECLALRR